MLCIGMGNKWPAVVSGGGLPSRSTLHLMDGIEELGSPISMVYEAHVRVASLVRWKCAWEIVVRRHTASTHRTAMYKGGRPPTIHRIWVTLSAGTGTTV